MRNVQFIIYNLQLQKRKVLHSTFYILHFQRGFTFVEAILYIAIVSVMLTALIPFAWSLIEGGSKSAVQQEVSSNARFISERIKYEIRNALGVNSIECAAPGKNFSLVHNTSSLNPTIITYDTVNSDVTIKQGTTGVHATPMPLNSGDVVITNFSCTRNISSDNLSENISVGFTVQQAYSGPRADFQFSMPVSVSAELRSN